VSSGGTVGGHSTLSKASVTTNTPSPLDPLESTFPLHAASSLGHLEVVSVLLGAGASVHSKNEGEGHTPLFLAARGGHEEVVGLLLKAGAHLGEEELKFGKWLGENGGNGGVWKQAGAL